MGMLDGKEVIVAGAVSDIGRDIALLAAAEGATVVVGHDDGPAAQAAAGIRAAGGTAVASHAIPALQASLLPRGRSADRFSWDSIRCQGAGSCSRRMRWRWSRRVGRSCSTIAQTASRLTLKYA
jgi:hypothetical protein